MEVLSNGASTTQQLEKVTFGSENGFVTKYPFTLNSTEILQNKFFLNCTFPIVPEDTVDTVAILHLSQYMNYLKK